MFYGVDAFYNCVVCKEHIKDRLFDHKAGCSVGRDERVLFAHDEIVEALKEFERFMGPCPLHGTPDFPNSIQQLHRWKALLIEAKRLCSEGLHQTLMRENWTEACKNLIEEVEVIEWTTTNPS